MDVKQYLNDHVGKLVAATWEEALSVVAKKLVSTKPEDISAIAGNFADAEVPSCATIELCIHIHFNAYVHDSSSVLICLYEISP